jgi:NADH-quinone oxidoreductase subunit N
MAYSSIGHMGYALIGLAAGTETGVRGVLLYLLTYVVMSAGVFACIIAMRRRGLAIEKISDLGGLAKNDLTLATLMAIFMLSMAGVPPFAGFFGKFFVFEAAVNANLWALAIIGMLTSVVALFYYLRVIKVMFFDPAVAPFDARDGSLSFVALATGAFTTVFIVFMAPFLGAAGAAAKALFG